MKTRSNTFTLEQFKEKNYGAKGTLKREKLEAGYQNFKLGALLQEARLGAGLTQEELAVKVGTTKSYISKLENDIKEVRLSNLQKIVELGLGGKLELSIKIGYKIEIDLYFSYFTSFNTFFVNTWSGTWPGFYCKFIIFLKI